MMTLIAKYLNEHGLEALQPRAVLFDMDGVLYDSMPLHAEAWQQSMAKFGISMTAADAYATEGARGIDTIRAMVEKQQGRLIGDEEAQEMYDEKTRIFHAMHEAPVMAGIPEVLALIASKGVEMGVVTGSGQRPLIERLLKDFGRYLTREHIVTAYDVRHGKPHPEPYEEGLRKMGHLRPWEAIVVENAPLGVRAGVAAGCLTVAVNTGPLPHQVLAEAGAHMVFNDMYELCNHWSAIVC